MLSVSQAKQRILSSLPSSESETVAVVAASGRIVATTLCANRPLPPHDNSAMDGFAVRSADLPGTLFVTGTIAAGAAPDNELQPKTTWRIMTGAPMPAAADAVVMRENVDDQGDHAVFADAAEAGQHVRKAGEDIAVGDVIAEPGTRIEPGVVGILAAQNMAAVSVARRPRVAILSTGDELVDVGTTPRGGQIVNSNAYALAAQIREAGGEPINIGIARDNLDDSIAKLRTGLDADMLLTIGGVSVGDFDFVKAAFDATGVKVDFWKVSIKPGKPLVFGHSAEGTPVFGLPGNPVSAMVTFEIFARPALLTMQGVKDVERPRARATLAKPYKKQPGRTHYIRAQLHREGDELIAEPHPKQGSGMLSSMVDVDAFMELPRDDGDQPAGTKVDALLLRAI